MNRFPFLLLTTATAALSACGGQESIVKGPTTIRSTYPIAAVERSNQGAIFQPNSTAGWIFQDAQPAHVGDTLKINISESLSGTSTTSTSTSRKNEVASKGPGTGDDSMSGLIRNILNMNASASGSDSFTGSGKTNNTNTLKGVLAASVVNVMPNGNLVVAGEKSVAFNGTLNTLRFSGVVNPKDIKSGRIVASEDVVDARLEQVGAGGVAQATSKNWLQRMLTDAMMVW
jgi:flagellar L-ring protein FlgH